MMMRAQEEAAVVKVETAEKSVMIDDPSLGQPTRRTFEGIEALAASMALEGQRRPVLRSPDGAVIKGWRRIRAAELLGWTTIKGRTVSTIEDAVEAILDQQDDSSIPRYQLEEIIDLASVIETLERRERPSKGAHGYDTNVIVAPGVGLPTATYKRGRSLVTVSRSKTRPAHVVETARQALSDYNAGKVTIYRAYSALRGAITNDTATPEGMGADGLPLVAPPHPEARSKKARALRIAWIRAMAAKGADSNQIAAKIGISKAGLKNICHQLGITIAADQVLNRTIRKAADPNKVLSVAIDDLDAMIWSLEKVDLSKLNPAEAVEWADRLKEHGRALERFGRAIVRGLKKE